MKVVYSYGAEILSLPATVAASTGCPRPFSPNFHKNFATSAIPFSWEKRPDVPKHSHCTKEHQQWAPEQRLPPSPSHRSNSDPFLSVTRKKRPELRLFADPFTVALMEGFKGDRHDPEDGYSPGTFWKAAAASSKAIGGRRRTIADLLGFVDLYASCKMTSSVADSMVYIPRSGRADMVAYGLLSRHAGRTERDSIREVPSAVVVGGRASIIPSKGLGPGHLYELYMTCV
ncbi:hypothetical protein Taro_007462 [Colocasia esculenta]|uniref:Uncharacterized protein n=1 Tax=Colocasia esculenta TaxID=4460 RepID=A0A843TU85_COLES|nr:hypothetical protein [Colocasia esculenta]